MKNPDIRAAQAEDIPSLYALLMELAEYERMLDSVRLTQEGFRDALFGLRPYLDAIMAFVDGEAVGFALFYPVYPTFLGRPGMYLEDIYVRPAARGIGIGKMLMSRVSQIALERGCGRLDWAVLDWNEPAIKFYESVGAKPKGGWTVYQLEGNALHQMAEHGGEATD